MAWHVLLLFSPLVVMLCWAAAVDLRTRRIANELVLVLMATGLAQSFTAYGTVAPGQAVLGFLVGGLLMLPLFLLGALGGGDVKLLAGVGTWLGAGQVLHVFLAAAVIGLLLVLSQATVQRRLWFLLRNSLLLAVNLVHVGQLGTEHARLTGASCRSVDKPLPYAVPVLLATVGLLLTGAGG